MIVILNLNEKYRKKYVNMKITWQFYCKGIFLRWKNIKHRKDIKMYQNEARKRREKIAEKLADGQLLLSFGCNDELGVVGIPQREKTEKNIN